MSKFLVVVFANEQSACEGSRALLELDRTGRIALYAGALVSKNLRGQVRVEDAIDEGPVGAAAGMLLGSLIGAIGGPETMLVGALGGTTGGWIGDLYNVGVDENFLNQVGSELAPGKFAVVAEASEGWSEALDSRMEEVGGTVLRRTRIDVEDAQIHRAIEATRRDLHELEAEWNQAAGVAKDRLKARVDAARTDLESLKGRADKKVRVLESEVGAKLNKLNEQIARASGETKAKFEQRRDEILAEFNERKASLKEAGDLSTQALTP